MSARTRNQNYASKNNTNNNAILLRQSMIGTFLLNSVSSSTNKKWSFSWYDTDKTDTNFWDLIFLNYVNFI